MFTWGHMALHYSSEGSCSNNEGQNRQTCETLYTAAGMNYDDSNHNYRLDGMLLRFTFKY